MIISETSWYMPISAAFSAFRFFPNLLFPMTQSAWEIIATSRECSERFSFIEFLISAQRSIYLSLDTIAKKSISLIIPAFDLSHASKTFSPASNEDESAMQFLFVSFTLYKSPSAE